MQLVKIVTHHENTRRAAQLFEKESVVAIGWKVAGDLRGKSRQQIKQFFLERRDFTEQESAYAASQLLAFRDQVKRGDTVLAYEGGNTVALIGNVVGSYEFNDRNSVGNPDGEVGYPHQIRVEWRSQPRNFDRSRLPRELESWVSQRGTIAIREYDEEKLAKALENISLNEAGNMRMEKQPVEDKYGSPWTRGEVILALALYKTPGISHDARDPEVQELAKLIDRSPGSVALKLGNIRALESGGRSGLSHFTSLDRQVWSEFQGRDNDLRDEADSIRTEIYSSNPELTESQLRADEERLLSGGVGQTERLSPTRQRQFTTALRRVVLGNYEGKCAICDLDMPELLEVAHIRRWSEDPRNRLNPANALCLCALHHEAFDQGLISVRADRKLSTSPRLKQSNSHMVQMLMTQLEGETLRAGRTFQPSMEFLAHHRSTVFKA